MKSLGIALLDRGPSKQSTAFSCQNGIEQTLGGRFKHFRISKYASGNLSTLWGELRHYILQSFDSMPTRVWIGITIHNSSLTASVRFVCGEKTAWVISYARLASSLRSLTSLYNSAPPQGSDPQA